MNTTPTPTPTPTPAAKPEAKPGMKQADIVLRLDKSGYDVSIKKVTPAEVLLLVAEHHANAGGDPIVELKETGTFNQTNTDEVERLRTKYAAAKVKALFQGAMPTLPATFDEARKAGISFVLPTNKLVEGQ